MPHTYESKFIAGMPEDRIVAFAAVSAVPKLMNLKTKETPTSIAVGFFDKGALHTTRGFALLKAPEYGKALAAARLLNDQPKPVMLVDDGSLLKHFARLQDQRERLAKKPQGPKPYQFAELCALANDTRFQIVPWDNSPLDGEDSIRDTIVTIAKDAAGEIKSGKRVVLAEEWEDSKTRLIVGNE